MKLLDATAAQATKATSNDASAAAALLQACILPVNKEVRLHAFMSLLQSFPSTVKGSMWPVACGSDEVWYDSCFGVMWMNLL